MTTTDAQIQAALLENLKTPALSGSPPIAYPFVQYSPIAGVAYLDARPVLRAAPESPSMGFLGSVIRKGVFQVDAVIPDGLGEAPGLALAALVAARFVIGTSLVAGGRKLQVVDLPSIAAALKDAAWVRFPVSIPYQLIDY